MLRGKNTLTAVWRVKKTAAGNTVETHLEIIFNVFPKIPTLVNKWEILEMGERNPALAF